ncbi:MAG: hypothetical protein Q9171_004615 [Xanthocarpia ochracea]
MSMERKRSPPRPLQPGTDVDTHAKLNVLCNACSQIYGHFDHLYHLCKQDGANTGSGYMINHHESVNALILSAQEKCHLCTLIVEVLDPAIIENMQENERRAGTIGRDISTRREPSYKLELRASFPPRSSIVTKTKEAVAHMNGEVNLRDQVRRPARIYCWLEVKLPRLQDHMAVEPGTAYSSTRTEARLEIEQRKEGLTYLELAESCNRIHTLSSSKSFSVDRVLIFFCLGSAVAR